MSYSELHSGSMTAKDNDKDRRVGNRTAVSTDPGTLITAEQIGSGLKGATSMEIYGGRNAERFLVARVTAKSSGRMEISTPAGFRAQVMDVERVASIVNGMVRRRIRHRLLAGEIDRMTMRQAVA